MTRLLQTEFISILKVQWNIRNGLFLNFLQKNDMKLLVEVILFAIPMVVLAWTLPRKYVLPSQIATTGLFIAYQSPLSFGILSTITLGNFYLLHKAVLPKSIKMAISLGILILLIVSAK